MLRCALQMRNVLRAENGGKVKAVHAKMGSSVSADEVLVEFE
jgi:acetyl/propionyl-CoA carboxylase alpha subunit